MSNQVMHRPNGFSLIELMIVVAIVGILAAIAYPSYIEHVAKGRRAEAKGALYDLLQREERYFTEHNTYTATMTDLGFGAGPYQTEHATHTLALAIGPTGDIATSVSVSAAPIIADARCGTLTLTNTHVTSASGTAPSICWR